MSSLSKKSFLSWRIRFWITNFYMSKLIQIRGPCQTLWSKLLEGRILKMAQPNLTFSWAKLTWVICLFDGAALQYKKRGMNANLITDSASKQRLPEWVAWLYILGLPLSDSWSCKKVWFRTLEPTAKNSLGRRWLAGVAEKQLMWKSTELILQHNTQDSMYFVAIWEKNSWKPEEQ